MGSPRLTAQTVAVLEAMGGGDSEKWRHGYELLGVTGLRSGTLYPILMRLASSGILETAWEEDAPTGRPRRHLYRLSGEGRRVFAELPKSTSRARLRRSLRPGVAT